jgi:hypothetical protein
MSINNKAAKECVAILYQAFDQDINAVIPVLAALSKVKSNKSFNDSMQLLLDCANTHYKDLIKHE